MAFTAQELAEMAAADAEIDAEFRLTNEDLKRSRDMDRKIKFDALPTEKRKVAEYQKAYREANREKVAASKKAYREARADADRECCERIRAARKSANLTQKEASSILGVSRETVSSWENYIAPKNWEEIIVILSANRM